MDTEKLGARFAVFFYPAAVALWFIGWNSTIGRWTADREYDPRASISLPSHPELERTWNAYIRCAPSVRPVLCQFMPASLNKPEIYEKHPLARLWLRFKEQQLQEIWTKGIHPETIDSEIESINREIASWEGLVSNSFGEATRRSTTLERLRAELAWFEEKRFDGTPVRPRNRLPYQQELDDIERVLAGELPICSIPARRAPLRVSSDRWPEPLWHMYDWFRRQDAFTLFLLASVMALIARLAAGDPPRQQQTAAEQVASPVKHNELPPPAPINAPDPVVVEQVELSLSRSQIPPAAAASVSRRQLPPSQRKRSTK